MATNHSAVPPPHCSLCHASPTYVCACGDEFCDPHAEVHHQRVERFGQEIRQLLAQEHERQLRSPCGWVT